MAALVADVELERCDGSKVSGSSLKDCPLVVLYFSAHWFVSINLESFSAHRFVSINLWTFGLLILRCFLLDVWCTYQVPAVPGVHTDPQGPLRWCKRWRRSEKDGSDLHI